MIHPDYLEISHQFRHLETWRDDLPLAFPAEGASLYYLAFESRNSHFLLGQSAYTCAEHDLTFPGEPVEDDPADCDIRENTSFRYPLVRETGNGNLHRHDRLTILLHGLNERSFGKYLPWAYHLWRETSHPVALFPLPLHVNRVLPAWGRTLRESYARRTHIPGNENAHRFNATISERLDRHPARFFWGGVQGYWDVNQLAAEIRADRHPHFTPDARIDLLGYSAGGYLTLALLLADHDELWTNSRAVVFASGAPVRDTNLASRFILDLQAEVALMKLFVKHLERDASARMRHWFDHHPEGEWMRLFCGLVPGHRTLAARLSELAPRVLGIANTNDEIMPPGAIMNALQGVRRDTNVRVEELDLGVHESPFVSASYHERDRRFVADFIDETRFGDGFARFINLAATHFGR